MKLTDESIAVIETRDDVSPFCLGLYLRWHFFLDKRLREDQWRTLQVNPAVAERSRNYRFTFIATSVENEFEEYRFCTGICCSLGLY